jgi:hypothetical protein
LLELFECLLHKQANKPRRGFGGIKPVPQRVPLKKEKMVFAVLGMEARASCMPGKCCTLYHIPAHLVISPNFSIIQMHTSKRLGFLCRCGSRTVPRAPPTLKFWNYLGTQ